MLFTNTEMSITALSSGEWLVQIAGFSLKIIFTGRGKKISEVSGVLQNPFVQIIFLFLQEDLYQQETEYMGSRVINIDVLWLSIVM